MIGCLKNVIHTADCIIIVYIKQTLQRKIDRYTQMDRRSERPTEILEHMQIYVYIEREKKNIEPYMYIYMEGEIKTNDEYMGMKFDRLIDTGKARYCH